MAGLFSHLAHGEKHGFFIGNADPIFWEDIDNTMIRKL
jgi:hypothetical protein